MNVTTLGKLTKLNISFFFVVLNTKLNHPSNIIYTYWQKQEATKKYQSLDIDRIPISFMHAHRYPHTSVLTHTLTKNNYI